MVHARGLQNREPGFESRLPCLISRVIERAIGLLQRELPRGIAGIGPVAGTARVPPPRAWSVA